MRGLFPAPCLTAPLFAAPLLLIAQALVQRGANIDAESTQHKTALIWAAVKNKAWGVGGINYSCLARDTLYCLG